jgi:hypothetical protein
MSEGWTEERVARLKAMVAEGGSAATIAEAFGGVSRNAIIGKCHRLGLDLPLPSGGEGKRLSREARGITPPRKPKAAARPPATRRPPPPKPAPAFVPPPRPLPVEPEVDATPSRWPKPAGPEAVSADDLRAEHCRMPLWGDLARSGLHCGKPVRTEGDSWCAACAKLVFERRPIRERELREMQQARAFRQSRSGAFQ